MPAPSPAQKIPNVVSITPTAYFIVFSGTRLSGRCTTRPTASTTTNAAAPIAASATLCCAAERDDDERHLEPFEEHAFERDGERVPVDAFVIARRGQRGQTFLLEDGVFVVQRLEAARAQDGFAQPLEPEDQQQLAIEKGQLVNRNPQKPRPKWGNPNESAPYPIPVAMSSTANPINANGKDGG